MLYLAAISVITSLLVHPCYCTANPNNLFNLVGKDVTFSQQQSPSYHQVTVTRQEMCFSHCQHDKSTQQCLSFAVQTIEKSKHTCSFFNATYSSYQTLVSVPGTLLYSKYFIPGDCMDWYRSGARKNGIYTIFINGKHPTEVKCKLKTLSGWTVIQRRVISNNTSSFMRTWDNYKNGFGELLAGNFWLGNENLHLLTSGTTKYELMLTVEYIEDAAAENDFYHYNSFKVSSEEDDYRLVLGESLMEQKDILKDFRDQPFATLDRSATDTRGCVFRHLSGWWYNYICGSPIITAPSSIHDDGEAWNSMMIRPAQE